VIIDSHCHIHIPSYDADRAEVIARAEAAGVEGLVVIGSHDGLQDCERALAVAAPRGSTWATLGVHPHDAKVCDEPLFEAIQALAAHEKVVAIGETGLDFYYDHSPREVQAAVFRRFVGMARQTGLPLCLHVRDAHPETIAILRETRAEEIGGVVHCFTGTREDARAYLALGFHLGITGIVTFKTATELQHVAATLPLDRLVVETDSPYLAPVPHRGKRNEPAWVVGVVEAIALARRMSFEEVAAITTENVRRAYRLS
jgi:TatD DNase family protein